MDQGSPEPRPAMFPRPSAVEGQADPLDDAAAFERRVVGKVSRRILPYLFLLYMVAYLDRINVGVARLQIARDLPIDESSWGLGMGLFFAGYFLFEVPGNLILSRIGARLWIARIMIVWGVVSSFTLFIRGRQDFWAARVLLGLAEAGFFPGILFYLTRWFRERDRARAMALFMAASSVIGAVGSPLSGAILEMDGLAGLKGWQWLFLLEGIPAVALGISVLFCLTDSPEQAKWLSPAERAWLSEEIAREQAGQGPAPRGSPLAVMIQPRVLCLTATYFFMACGSYGFELWLPEILKSVSGASNFRVTLLTSVPYLLGMAALVAVAARSDRTGERRRYVTLSVLVAAVGFTGAALSNSPLVTFCGLVAAWSGIKAFHGPVWAIPPSFLTGAQAAVGMAFINSVGNLGGLAGPWIVGILRKGTNSFSSGLLMSGLFLSVATFVSLFLPRGGQGTPHRSR